jgi:hypothetical protein
MTILWYEEFSLIFKVKRFEGTCCFHLHGGRWRQQLPPVTGNDLLDCHDSVNLKPHLSMILKKIMCPVLRTSEASNIAVLLSTCHWSRKCTAISHVHAPEYAERWDQMRQELCSQIFGFWKSWSLHTAYSVSLRHFYRLHILRKISYVKLRE